MWRGVNLQLVKGGAGEPLLILHDEMGHPGWLRFHEALSQQHTLYIPSTPRVREDGAAGLDNEHAGHGRLVPSGPGRVGSGPGKCPGGSPWGGGSLPRWRPCAPTSSRSWSWLAPRVSGLRPGRYSICSCPWERSSSLLDSSTLTMRRSSGKCAPTTPRASR